MSDHDDAPALTAEVILNRADGAPPPLRGTRRQLDILARQLLAYRSGLEAVRAVVDAQFDQLGAQLDAAFAVLGGLQDAAELAEAARTFEVPADDPPAPRVFGAKRRAEAISTVPPAPTPRES